MKISRHYAIFLTAMFPICVIASAQVSKPKAAYVGIPIETRMPFLEVENSLTKPKIKSGILKELAEALLKELGIAPTLVLLPKKRIAPDLISGDISIVCYTNEAWIPHAAKEMHWSKDFATNTNLIVGVRANNSKVKGIEDLYGKNVGTIINFFYQNLDPYFEKSLILKDPGPDNESNIKKLLFGRIDYMILSSLEFDFHKKSHPQLVAYDLGLDLVKVKCAVSKKSDINLPQLNKAIDKLQQNGTLRKIFTP
jgi:polar amino acid transport system substrate-binding protein